MSSNDDMEARHGRMLAELAEAGMGMARRLSGALAEAEGVQELVQLGEAFHRVSKSVRQTIALEFKLRHPPREPATPKAVSKPAAPPPPERERPDPVERVYWSEYERADWDEPLEALLDSGDRDAINEAVETSIARIRRDLAAVDGSLRRHPGVVAAHDPNRMSSAPQAASGRRSALLATSSPMGPGLHMPRYRDDGGGGNAAPRTPPWRNSG